MAAAARTFESMLAALRAPLRRVRPLRGPARGFGVSSRPELPIPQLEDTLDRFLTTVDPLLTEAEREDAARAVDEFRRGDGPKLQKMLLEYAATPEYLPDRQYMRGSYLEAFWDDMYLAPRDSIVVNSNPFLTFQHDPVEQRRTQARRAANLIYNSVLFLQLVQTNALELGNECPSQYWQLFRSTRLPRLHRDAVWTSRDTQHVTILHKGRFYELPVLTNGEPKSEARIARALERVLSECESLPAPEVDVSTLTQLPRDDWARLYGALRDTSADNWRAVESIGSSILHLVLEDRAPGSEAERCSLMLHGAGRGRWHDKSASLVVFPDGDAGLSFEHSWGDGQTLLRWANDINERPFERTAPHVPVPGVADIPLDAEHLGLETTDYVRAGMHRAGQFAADLAASVSMQSTLFSGFGKDAIKAAGLSPDATIQVAYQRAFRRTFGFAAPTYESCSTKHYKHGRTETIRPCTHEAQRFAQVEVDDPRAGELLRAAVETHAEIAKRAQRGEGVDRHLFALAHVASRNGMPAPALFASDAFRTLKYDHMSTSNCSSELLKWFGFGPTTPDCYGVGYMIYKDGVSFTVSSWNKDTQRLAQGISEALSDIGTIIKQA